MPDHNNGAQIRLGELDHPQMIALATIGQICRRSHRPKAATRWILTNCVRPISPFGRMARRYVARLRRVEDIGRGACRDQVDAHRARHLRQGVAAALLKHLLEQARSRGDRRVSLETGSMADFLPARALYTRFGFALCGPFDGDSEDPNSVFMTRML